MIVGGNLQFVAIRSQHRRRQFGAQDELTVRCHPQDDMRGREAGFLKPLADEGLGFGEDRLEGGGGGATHVVTSYASARRISSGGNERPSQTLSRRFGEAESASRNRRWINPARSRPASYHRPGVSSLMTCARPVALLMLRTK